jgi:PIN domain nuclease of toxin-antitoxin system
MRLLVDTHLAIWSVSSSKRLSASARQLLTDPANVLLVSVVSLWEIAIKRALPQRADPFPYSARRSLEMLRDSGYELLDLCPEHAVAVEQLPLLHTDPFDRLLLAQARTEGMTLCTGDDQLAAYGHRVFPV